MYARRLTPGFRIGSAYKARFDADGRRLVTLGKWITLWGVEARERIGTGPPLPHAGHVDFSPDGAMIVAKNTVGDVLLLDGQTLEERARFAGRPYGEGAEIRFSADGELLIDGSWSGRLLVRECPGGEILWEESVVGAMIAALTCTRDRRVWAYTRDSGEGTENLMREWPFWERPAVTVATERHVTALALTEDGCPLAAIHVCSAAGHAPAPRAHGELVQVGVRIRTTDSPRVNDIVI